MQDGYPVTWMGSEDVKDKTGIGTFVIDDNSYDIPLCNFKHCQTIKKMINKAFTQGRDFSEGRISDCLVRAINDKAKNREFIDKVKKDMMDFSFKHKLTGETITVTLDNHEIQSLIENELYDKIINDCKCGRNVSTCDCYELLDQPLF